MKKQQTKAFTLVELIIVITILSILSTIGFMSYSSYTSDARDANRTTSLDEIRKWLDIYSAKTSNLPSPENPVNITASWVIIWYQWTFWDTLSSTIKISQTPLDPSDNSKYIYATNATKTKYQLLWYLENQTSYNPSITNQAYAIDYTTRKFKTFWDKLGIILNSDNSPISSSVETQTGTTNYNLVFSDTNSYTLSWNLLSVIQAFRWDKNLVSLDNTLVWYWDMETLTNSWTQTVLKDLSQYHNNWVCYNARTAVNCGTSWLWPQIVDWNWTTWKAMSFDWIDDSISIYWVQQVAKFTIIAKVKYNIITTPISINQEILSFDWWSEGSYFFRLDSALNESPRTSMFIYDWTTPELRSRTLNMQDTRNTYNFISNFDWNILKIFQNWIFQSQQTRLPISYIWSNNYLYLWRADSSINFLNWNIDEIHIYNQTLSDSAIKAIYDTTK